MTKTNAASRRTDRFLWGIFKFLLDPIVFISFLAPTVISYSISALSHESISSLHATSSLFNDKAFPGIIDYVMQYYATCIAYVLWTFMAGAKVCYPLIIQGMSNGKDADRRLYEHGESIWAYSERTKLIYGIFTLLIFLFGIFLFYNL